jgi:hypothetical protein
MIDFPLEHFLGYMRVFYRENTAKPAAFFRIGKTLDLEVMIWFCGVLDTGKQEKGLVFDTQTLVQMA